MKIRKLMIIIAGLAFGLAIGKAIFRKLGADDNARYALIVIHHEKGKTVTVIDPKNPRRQVVMTEEEFRKKWFMDSCWTATPR